MRDPVPPPGGTLRRPPGMETPGAPFPDPARALRSSREAFSTTATATNRPSCCRRSALERWFADSGVRPRIVGQFDDSAFLEVFGAAG